MRLWPPPGILLCALTACADTQTTTVFEATPEPPARPAQSKVQWNGRALGHHDPGSVSHNTRFVDRYMIGVIGLDEETQWRFHLRLKAEDLKVGVIRGELAPLLDVGDQANTGATRIASAIMSTTVNGQERIAEATQGTFEVTLTTDHVRGWVKATPVDGIDVSASFEAELETLCLVEEVVPPPKPGEPEYTPTPRQPPTITFREDASLTAPGCAVLRAFVTK